MKDRYRTATIQHWAFISWHTRSNTLIIWGFRLVLSRSCCNRGYPKVAYLYVHVKIEIVYQRQPFWHFHLIFLVWPCFLGWMPLTQPALTSSLLIFSSSDKQIYPITEPDTSINVIVLKLKPVNRFHKICKIAQQKIRVNISYKKSVITGTMPSRPTDYSTCRRRIPGSAARRM